MIYSADIKEASEIHFTPVVVCIVAARYLAEVAGARVLDIGAGAGKFCVIGALCTEGKFTGVELRQSFTEEALQICDTYQLTNVEFVHANIMEISFTDYDAFYIFNPFQENISIAERINDEIILNTALYDEYSFYVKAQLDKMPVGTKLVTYFSYCKEVPPSYQMKSSDFSGKLKFWVKVM